MAPVPLSSRSIAGPTSTERALVVPVTELMAGNGATLSYVSLQMLNDAAWSIARLAARGGADSFMRTFTIGLGGDYDRVRADVSVDGRGARSEILSTYLGHGTQVHDIRTLQDHVAPRTNSELLCQGAVAGHVALGLQRSDPGAPRGGAFRRPADQPQPGARRGCTRGFGSEPGHFGERREVFPRIHRRADRRGSALLHRVAGCGARCRRGPDRAGILRPHHRSRPDPRRDTAPQTRSPRAARRSCSATVRWPGRWTMPESVVLCRVDDLSSGQARRFDVAGHRIALVRTDDEFHAVGDRCSHENYSLAEGEVWVEEREIECPRHGSTFSLLTGSPCSLPATHAVAVYEVRNRGRQRLGGAPVTAHDFVVEGLTRPSVGARCSTGSISRSRAGRCTS